MISNPSAVPFEHHSPQGYGCAQTDRDAGSIFTDEASTTHPAIDFLASLDPEPDARYNIEAFSDVPPGTSRPRPAPLLRRYADLTLQEVEALLPELQAANNQGAGIFVTRNRCAGHRSKDAVTRVRGVHADLDGISAEQLEAIRTRLNPTFLVQTSKLGHYQLYWQLASGETLEANEAEQINRQLVHFGADPAAVDVSRLLRLPGFRHMKRRDAGIMPMVQVLDYGPDYTAAELRAAFDTVDSAGPTKRNQVGDRWTPGAVTGSDALTEIATRVSASFPALWSGDWGNAPRSNGTRGYPSGSEADLALCSHITRACRQSGLPDDQIAGAVETVFNASSPGSAEKWVTRHDYRARTIAKALSSASTVAPSPRLTLTLDSYGDIRNARALAAKVRGSLVYVASRDRWLIWRGDRWWVCEKEEHVAMAKEVCDEILSAARAVFQQDQDRGKPLIQDAIASHKLPRITAMLRLAASEPGMTVTSAELDSDPYLLGVQNGVVDLRVGQLIPNHPNLLITRYCDAAFDERAVCPTWEGFLQQIFENDAEKINCVQRLLGCTLLGLSGEEILIICYGHGINGKSVFAIVVHRIMGDHAVTAPPSLLTVRRAGDAGPRNDLAALAGARYVSINELQSGDRLDEQIVKMLAGREPIAARFLNQEFFEFQPAFTPWLRTNHKPVIVGEDDGIWRRLILLQFGRKFSEQEQDPKLEEKLLKERNGILGWMVQGAKLYLEGGLCISPRMRADLNTYRRDSDVLGDFLAEHTLQQAEKRIKQSELYSSYMMWCRDSGLRYLSKKSFTQRLAERGHPESKSGADRYYLGLVSRPLASFATGGQDRMNGIEGCFHKSPHVVEIKKNLRTDVNPVQPVLPTLDDERMEAHRG